MTTKASHTQAGTIEYEGIRPKQGKFIATPGKDYAYTKIALQA